MIKQGIVNDSILEKKFKILRTSIMLGNIKNRDEMLSNYEDTARNVEILRNNVYFEPRARSRHDRCAAWAAAA